VPVERDVDDGDSRRPSDERLASAMLQAAADARPRRQSPLEHALANEGVIEYHPVEQVPE
jgi:hypothetical protein